MIVNKQSPRHQEKKPFDRLKFHFIATNDFNGKVIVVFSALFVFHPVIEIHISFTFNGLLFVVQLITLDYDDNLFVRHVCTAVSSMRPSSIPLHVLMRDKL